VSRAIAEAEGFRGEELEQWLAAFAGRIFQSVESEEKIEAVVVRYAKPRIDRMKIVLSGANTTDDIEAAFAAMQ
jgi:hypothetical protein